MNLNYIKQFFLVSPEQSINNSKRELGLFANFIYYFTIAETIFVSTLVVVIVFMVSIGVINIVSTYNASSLFLNYFIIAIVYLSYIAIKAVLLSYALLLKTASGFNFPEAELILEKREKND